MEHPETTCAQQRTHLADPAAPPFALLFGWIGGWLAWFTICRAYYRAAITYEELYRLPEGELKHRGYTRATLARDVTGFDVTQHPNC
jgi:hypothetical protein